MRFYKPLVNKKADIIGFIIGFILIALLTGCGQSNELPATAENIDAEYTTEYPDDTKEPEAPVATQTPAPTQKPVLAETPAPTKEPAPTQEPSAESPEEPAVSAIPDIEITDTTIAASGGYKAFSFRTDGYIGAVLDMEHFKELQYELYYGLHVTTDGSIVSYTAYDHTKDGVAPVKTWITFEETGNSAIVDTASCDQPAAIDLKGQDNGLYSLHTTFDNDVELVLPLYMNAGQAYIVQAVLDTASDKAILNAIAKPTRIRELAESYNVTPEKSLSVDPVDIAYPVLSRYENSTARCDTELWAALAHEIVPDETLSDSVKVVMLHDWMTQNLAYDDYKVNVCKEWRAGYYDDFTGTWNVYNTHTGVCEDFTNIFAIMCRELGIPCGSLDTDNHTWNIVWLDEQWQEIELTQDIKRHTYKKDVTDIRGYLTIYYKGFLPLTEANDLSEVNNVNWCLQCASYRQDGYCHDCIHTR